MTLIYNQLGQVQMICDTCSDKTAFYDTLPELLAAINFNVPLTDDNAGWCYGLGQKIIGPGFQPMHKIDPFKQTCYRCRGFFETLSYASIQDFHKYDGKIGKIGRPDQTSAMEDEKLDAPLKPLFN